MPEQQFRITNLILALLVLGLLALLAALPSAILAAIFGGWEGFKAIYIIHALLIFSWYPLKLLLDKLLRGEAKHIIPIDNIPLLLPLFVFIGLVFTPLFWFLTFQAFAIGILAYIFSQNVFVALSLAFGVQIFNLYRRVNYEKATGDSFIRYVPHDMQANFRMVELRSSDVGVQADEALQLLSLPSENTRQSEQD